jgi:hypothetical protein
VKTYEGETFRLFGRITDIAEAKKGIIAVCCQKKIGFLYIKENKIVWHELLGNDDTWFISSRGQPEGCLIVYSVCCDFCDHRRFFAIFDMNDMKLKNTFVENARAKICFLTQERLAIGNDKGITFLDMKTGAQKHAQHSDDKYDQYGDCAPWYLLRLSERLLCATYPRCIKIWDTETGALVKTISDIEFDPTLIRSLPNNFNLILMHCHISNRSRPWFIRPIRILNPVTGKITRLPSWVWDQYNGDLVDPVLSNDHLVTASGNEIKLWS